MHSSLRRRISRRKRSSEKPSRSVRPQVDEQERAVFRILLGAVDHYNLGTCVRIAGGWVRAPRGNICKVSKNSFFLIDIVAKFWRARSRLYRSRFVQVNLRFAAAGFELYKTCTLDSLVRA